MLSGIVAGILLSYIVSLSRRKLKNKKPQSSRTPQATEVDTSYQELDILKMNQEDNYQSLLMNSAGNGIDSTYTELNTTRDVEDNYQSLV